MIISNTPISHTVGVVSGRTRHSIQIQVSVGRGWTCLNPESGGPGIKFLSPITSGSRNGRFKRTLIDSQFHTIVWIFVPFVAAVVETIAQSIDRHTDAFPSISTLYLIWRTGTLNNRRWGAALKLDIIDCENNWCCRYSFNINGEKCVLKQKIHYSSNKLFMFFSYMLSDSSHRLSPLLRYLSSRTPNRIPIVGNGADVHRNDSIVFIQRIWSQIVFEWHFAREVRPLKPIERWTACYEIRSDGYFRVPFDNHVVSQRIAAPVEYGSDGRWFVVRRFPYPLFTEFDSIIPKASV